ncbi:MAG: hypothetical protein CMI60_15295 [Parvibaculum sp.]|jgi:uncharacterized protein (DUF1330 family)|nr:hypothetical protein [Parvibaculum sp.]|tara:strand:+ start:792 stop:1247 length:456 start_codon:yes stop_codon:yes gene_type:complete
MSSSKESILTNLAAFYGTDPNMPTATQWAHLFELQGDAPLAAVNYVKLRDQARYAGYEDEPAASGLEAMMRYSAGSIPRAEAMGGHFLLSGLHQGTVIGPGTDWDMIIVGHFPSPAAYLSLFVDPEYQAIFHHRRAAVDTWRAVLSTGNAA